MYIGQGGEFFEPGSAKIAVNNQHGVDALNMMKDYKNTWILKGFLLCGD